MQPSRKPKCERSQCAEHLSFSISSSIATDMFLDTAKFVARKKLWAQNKNAS